MIVETFRHEEDAGSGSIGHARLALLAVATSIDALAVGVSFAFSPPGMPLIAACALIGLVTFCLCVGGALLAGRLRSLDARWAGRIGGLVLIGIGVRILIDTIL
jgi:putative Mn2+ efflux pump MntP